MGVGGLDPPFPVCKSILKFVLCKNLQLLLGLKMYVHTLFSNKFVNVLTACH